MPKYLTHEEQLEALAKVADALNTALNVKRVAIAVITQLRDNPGSTDAERAVTLATAIRRSAIAARSAQRAFDLIDSTLKGVSWDKTTDIRAERTRVNQLRSLVRVSGNELLLEMDTKLDWMMSNIMLASREQEVAS